MAGPTSIPVATAQLALQFKRFADGKAAEWFSNQDFSRRPTTFEDAVAEGEYYEDQFGDSAKAPAASEPPRVNTPPLSPRAPAARPLKRGPRGTVSPIIPDYHVKTQLDHTVARISITDLLTKSPVSRMQLREYLDGLDEALPTERRRPMAGAAPGNQANYCCPVLEPEPSVKTVAIDPPCSQGDDNIYLVDRPSAFGLPSPTLATDDAVGDTRQTLTTPATAPSCFEKTAPSSLQQCKPHHTDMKPASPRGRGPQICYPESGGHGHGEYGQVQEQNPGGSLRQRSESLSPVLRGLPLSPFLFNLFVDWVVREALAAYPDSGVTMQYGFPTASSPIQ
ncbi:hypothetical protein N2152v2_009335 [Parachlorella kessleri]